MFKKLVLDNVINNIISKPYNNSFCINDKYFTYEDLGIAISKIRKALLNAKIKERNIGLVINDDLETYASIFALWMENKCYVPLHPLQPLDRCQDIMSQIESDCIIDSSAKSRYQNYKVILTNKLSDFSELYLDEIKGTDDDLAYILFTSGSTGKPKGVMLSRRNVASFVDSYFALGYEITENDRCLQCFDLTFDLSIGSYLIPLIKGACVYTVQLDAIKYSRIYELLEDYELTSALMVPSTIRYLQPYFSEIDLPKLRYSLFCGEALHEDILKGWKKCVPNAIVDNVYGPTENTIYCSCYRCGETLKAHNGILSIGKSMKNCDWIVIDDEENILPQGEAGELCLCGDQLTPGYINNPSKNEESFFVKNNTRYYKSGDICFQDESGDYMYVGRKDSQAKIQGFRVELSEIEFHAKTFMQGSNAVAIAFENSQHLTEIALFIESVNCETVKLENYLKKKMPSYMIPSRIYFEEIFPLNGNGKIDKVRLKQIIKC